jgi:glycosyltransferase involved in cell wall biosynthesis
MMENLQKNWLIGVDGRTIFDAPRRGIGKTLLDLYRHVAAMKPDWRFLFFHQRNSTDNPFAGLGNVTVRKIDIPGDRLNLWQQIRLPLAAKAAGVNLLHCPANTAPRYTLVPMVVTIHDLIPLDISPADSATQSWAKNVYHAACHARRIITPSHYSRDKIVQRFGVQTDKIIVNPWAPADDCRRVDDAEMLCRIKVRYGLEKSSDFVLAFGASDPRKNTERLLQAWAQLPEMITDHYRLLLIGIQDSAMARFQKLTAQLGLADRCILHSYADNADLPALLSGATVLCYPSLSEGFGLPILDALACGTAVLTSTTTSLPEVAGDAAVLVEPTDVAAIAGGLVRLLGNDELRKQNVRLGFARVKEFTWQRCAERLICVFEDVMKSARR